MAGNKTHVPVESEAAGCRKYFQTELADVPEGVVGMNLQCMCTGVIRDLDLDLEGRWSMQAGDPWGPMGG